MGKFKKLVHLVGKFKKLVGKFKKLVHLVGFTTKFIIFLAIRYIGILKERALSLSSPVHKYSIWVCSRDIRC